MVNAISKTRRRYAILFMSLLLPKGKGKDLLTISKNLRHQRELQSVIFVLLYNSIDANRLILVK